MVPIGKKPASGDHESRLKSLQDVPVPFKILLKLVIQFLKNILIFICALHVLIVTGYFLFEN